MNYKYERSVEIQLSKASVEKKILARLRQCACF